MEESKKAVATPFSDKTSSVFLTPPLSDQPKKRTDMKSQKFPLIQNLMLTPISPEKLKTEDHADIITRFYLQGYPLILEQIFTYLSPNDLQNCLAVCSIWNLFCSNLDSIASRLPTKVKLPLMPGQKENDQVTKITFKKQTKHPLTSHNTNMALLQESNASSIPATKQTKCPSCCSPAREYNIVYAECFACAYSFCPTCFGEAHTNNRSCKRIRSSPTKRGSSQLSVGTKQSKKRLRRL